MSISVLYRWTTAALAGMSLLAAPGVALPGRQDVSILSVPVASFHVENATTEAALRALRQTDHLTILIGLEKVARREDEKESTVSLSLSNSTVGEILNALCQQDPRYTYEILSGVLIHVYPKNGLSDPAGLLSIRVAKFSVDGKIAPFAVIERIGELAPELASYLRDKQNEYYAHRGVLPGSPGANMSGNMDPQIHVDLRDMTVRKILNAVVLYSLQLNKKTPPDWTGYKIPPTSWIYEFIIDPAAPTGLGGTPRWRAF